MRHLAQFLAAVHNGSIMCTAPGHKDITAEQVTLRASRVSGAYRVTCKDLAAADLLLRTHPELGLISLGEVALGRPSPVIELVANWYAQQVGIM